MGRVRGTAWLDASWWLVSLPRRVLNRAMASALPPPPPALPAGVIEAAEHVCPACHASVRDLYRAAQRVAIAGEGAGREVSPDDFEARFDELVRQVRTFGPVMTTHVLVIDRLAAGLSVHGDRNDNAS